MRNRLGQHCKGLLIFNTKTSFTSMQGQIASYTGGGEGERMQFSLFHSSSTLWRRCQYPSGHVLEILFSCLTRHRWQTASPSPPFTLCNTRWIMLYLK